ncbi:MAG: hypothetical protein VKN33_08565 [Candidatus Sericytochromatia bacterium]|nr:hypothetical protein [Candidatus Sericytochromatia bacterium]
MSLAFPDQAHRWQWQFTIGVLALPLAACATQPLAVVGEESRVSNRASTAMNRPLDAGLINEGGPVFAAPPLPPETTPALINEGGPVFMLPGEVVFPGYFRGNPALLTVSAEALGGSRITTIAPAPLGSDGKFTMRIPQDTGAFMASTVFTQDEYLYRMRTLVKPVEGGQILIDPTSTLVSAKLGQAYQRGLLLDLDKLSQPTIELMDNLRFGIHAEEWGRVQLDGDNLSLGRSLAALTGLRPHLEVQVNAWEALINEQPWRARASEPDIESNPEGPPK